MLRGTRKVELIISLLFAIPSQMMFTRTAYLQNLQHQAAVCDRCFELIRGPWFHCIYCAKDYCEDCETLDAHDPTHIYLMFKSHVEMQLFRYVIDILISIVINSRDRWPWIHSLQALRCWPRASESYPSNRTARGLFIVILVIPSVFLLGGAWAWVNLFDVTVWSSLSYV